MLKTKIVHDFVKFSEGISYQLSNHVKTSRSVPSAPRSESGHLSRRSSSLIVINNRYSSWIIMNDHYMIMIISWWSIINYNSQYVFYEVWFISASFYHWSPAIIIIIIIVDLQALCLMKPWRLPWLAQV
jgi:hypothetical protein